MAFEKDHFSRYQDLILRIAIEKIDKTSLMAWNKLDTDILVLFEVIS